MSDKTRIESKPVGQLRHSLDGLTLAEVRSRTSAGLRTLYGVPEHTYGRNFITPEASR